MEVGSRIRVLIVDDVAETRENIRKLLQFENDFEVIGAAGSGREGIELTKELDPEVVLMDINMPDMDGITATELIRRINGYTQIVILSVQGDPNYMRRAMLAGARDFLTKPPAVDELTDAIRRAGQMAFDERAKLGPAIAAAGGTKISAAQVSRGRVVVVYSPKGGTGNTTIAVNLAVGLQNEETPVAIVDGNLEFGDVAIFLDQQAPNTVLDLTTRADELDAEVVDEVMVEHKRSGLRLLAAPNQPEYAGSVGGEDFSKVLEFLRKIFAYIIVDVSSTLTDVALGAIDSADLIVLVTTQDIPAIKNARLFLDLADVMKIDRDHILFVMNRYDKRIGITPEKVGNSFKQKIINVIPLDERVIIPAANRGTPFLLGDRSKPAAKSILSLSDIILKNIAEIRETELAAAQ
jgi:pilus assembly protein CpaE